MLIDDCIKANLQDVCVPKHLLQDAQVFVFDDITQKTIRNLTEKLDYKDIQKQFKPPYPVTWIEQYSQGDNYDGSKYSIRFGWLIDYKDENSYRIYICSGMGLSPSCTEVYDHINGEIFLSNVAYKGLHNGKPNFMFTDSDCLVDENGIKDDMFWPVHAMMIYVFGLNFRELVKVERQDFEKLNNKRVKASKLPLKSRNIVTIKLRTMVYDKNDNNARLRNLPRMHLRRGHFMKFKDRIIWRRVALVGKSGFVKKDYTVKA